MNAWRRIGLTLLTIGLLLLVASSAGATAHSTNVAIIGGPNVVNGGSLPSSGSDLTGITFATLAPAVVNATSLAAYDTAVLNVSSSSMPTGLGCNVNNLTAQQKTDIVNFVGSGKKLIIVDSECSPQDYSWLPFPFTTNNPGARGAQGTLNIVENSTLASSNAADASYIDAGALATQTDAVGDMNVMTTKDSAWCLSASGTNVNGVTGPVLTYAKYGNDAGLFIYNGFDQDYAGYGNTGAAVLRKIYVLELQQAFNPSNLPCGVKVVGITLSPATATNTVGTSHTVTATLKDLTGAPQPGVTVTFTITGPNNGATPTYNPTTRTTDSSGQVALTYTGASTGTDTITGCFTPSGASAPVCDSVSKVWVAASNQPPVPSAGGSYSGKEGAQISLSGSVTDPDAADTPTLAWSYTAVSGVDAGAICSFGDATKATTTVACTDDGTFKITLTANDGHNSAVSSDATVVVSNVSPAVAITGPTPGALFKVGEPITFTGTYTDPGSNDTHTAQWTLDSTVVPVGTITGGTVTKSYSFGAAGVYYVSLAVTDDDGDTGIATQVNGLDAFVVVYDPSAGFVTGGGWIKSGAGAYKLDQSMAGKANFGFVSKYQKGASIPTGETEFIFHAAGMNFHSLRYEWLVVNQNVTNAQFKGSGTINGQLDPNGQAYRFMIWAGDGSPDTFRIKIWYEASGTETVVYDNGKNQQIDGGSIVIHK